MSARVGASHAVLRAVASATAAAAAASESPASKLDELIQRLRKFSTCDVGDILVRLGNKRGGVLHGLSRTPAPTSSYKICGQAVTVKMCNYGGALGPAMQPLVEYNQHGKVMVIETPPAGKAIHLSACWGAMESARAKALGAEGVVISGNMRQVSQCQEIGFPVLSRGTAVLGPREYMRIGKVNGTVTISGINVHPDDIVLADENGVISVQPQQLAEVIEACEKAVNRDRAVLEAIESGESMEAAIQQGSKLPKLPKARIKPFRW